MDITVADILQICSSVGLGGVAIWLIMINGPQQQRSKDERQRETESVIREMQKEFTADLDRVLATFASQNDKKDALFREAMQEMINILKERN